MIKSEKATVLQFYLTDTTTGEFICWLNLMNVAVGVFSLFQLYTTTPHRRKGYATRLVEDVIKWADREKVIIQLEVSNWGVIGLNNEELFKWYTDLGFRFHSVVNSKMYLEYKPKTINTGNTQ